jgi:hypothetical protein
MNEMKRRVAAILEFVNKMRGDKGSQNQSHGSSSGPSGSRTPNGVAQGSSSGASGNVQPAALLKGVEAGLSAAQVNGEKTEREFRDMASGEMMHVLTRELVGWQSLYGKYGEKWYQTVDLRDIFFTLIAMDFGKMEMNALIGCRCNYPFKVHVKARLSVLAVTFQAKYGIGVLGVREAGIAQILYAPMIPMLR